ncbi:hypothetical protein FJZ22_02770 [Candidatus Pacearchaeota archaeon]|nr:hypothetical protein [Candidatus Pacearchaeota archaeon]
MDPIDPAVLNHLIRKNGRGFLRNVFSVFDSEARDITWQSEMLNGLDLLGFEATSIKKDDLGSFFDDMDKGTDAVLLVLLRSSLLSYHWDAIYIKKEVNGSLVGFQENPALGEWTIRDAWIINSKKIQPPVNGLLETPGLSLD